MSYLLRFAEKDDSGLWKIRQLGVYHKYDKTLDSHLWILLQSHPPEKDSLSKRLDIQFESQPGRTSFNSCPFMLHDLILETYLPQWRSYLNFLGDTYADLVSPKLQFWEHIPVG